LAAAAALLLCLLGVLGAGLALDGVPWPAGSAELLRGLCVALTGAVGEARWCTSLLVGCAVALLCLRVLAACWRALAVLLAVAPSVAATSVICTVRAAGSRRDEG
jgi:hypothetical protein